MACTLILTALNIGEAGNKISSMAMELRHGLIKHDTREIMSMEEKKGKVNLLGLMAPTLMESSRTTIFTAKVHTSYTFYQVIYRNLQLVRWEKI